MPDIVNLVHSPWLGKLEAPKGTASVDVLYGLMSNCLLNIGIYSHRFVQLSALIGEASVWSG